MNWPWIFIWLSYKWLANRFEPDEFPLSLSGFRLNRVVVGVSRSSTIKQALAYTILAINSKKHGDVEVANNDSEGC